MSTFYINYLKKHHSPIPKYVLDEIKSNLKHKIQVQQVYCGTMKQEKINKQLKSQSYVTRRNYERVW